MAIDDTSLACDRQYLSPPLGGCVAIMGELVFCHFDFSVISTEGRNLEIAAQPLAGGAEGEAVKKEIEDRSQDILLILVMSNRIRRHVDPFQCRIALSPGAWLKAYEAHGQGDIWMDLGCGKGEFLAGLAEIYPRIFFIGIEVRQRVAEKYFPKHQHLTNLVLLHGNVNLSIPSMMDGHKVQKVFIHFPDPYSHKDRYKKRRIVNEAFVEVLCEILAAGGTVSVKTDDLALFQDVDALLSASLEPAPAPVSALAEATILTEWEQECIRKSMPIYCKEYRLN